MDRLGTLPSGLVRHLRGIRFNYLRNTAGAACRPGRLVPALVALFAVIMTTPAGGHEQVTVRAGIHPGFGRLVLEWPAPVEVEGRQEGSRYRLSFGRPLAVALDPVVARLGAYLKSAHLGPDRRELAFELAPGIAVRQAVEHGRIVVLDLAPDSTVRQAHPSGAYRRVRPAAGRLR